MSWYCALQEQSNHSPMAETIDNGIVSFLSLSRTMAFVFNRREKKMINITYAHIIEPLSSLVPGSWNPSIMPR